MFQYEIITCRPAIERLNGSISILYNSFFRDGKKYFTDELVTEIEKNMRSNKVAHKKATPPLTGGVYRPGPTSNVTPRVEYGKKFFYALILYYDAVNGQRNICYFNDRREGKNLSQILSLVKYAVCFVGAEVLSTLSKRLTSKKGSKKGSNGFDALREICAVEPMVGDAMTIVLNELGLSSATLPIIQVSSSCYSMLVVEKNLGLDLLIKICSGTSLCLQFLVPDRLGSKIRKIWPFQTQSWAGPFLGL